MKNIFLLAVAFFTLNLAFAQEIEIVFNGDKEVLLNGEVLTTETSLEDMKALLGEPTVYKEYKTGKVNYHYPDLGIAVHFVNDQLLFIGANFNWDGDENFPQTAYEGKLSIDKVAFDKESSSAKVSEIQVIEIKCMIPAMCMTNPQKEKTLVVIGFKDDLLTQIGFEFH